MLPDCSASVKCATHYFQVVVTHNGKIMSKLDVKFEPMGVDIHPGGTTVAVGSSVSFLLLHSSIPELIIDSNLICGIL